MTTDEEHARAIEDACDKLNKAVRLAAADDLSTVFDVCEINEIGVRARHQYVSPIITRRIKGA